MPIDAVFNGTPDSNTQPSGQARIGVDINTNQLYVQTPLSDGWQPNAGAAGGTNVEINSVPVGETAIFTDGDTVTWSSDEDGNIFAHTVGVITPTTNISGLNAGSNDIGVFTESTGLLTALRIGLFTGYDIATGSAAVGTLTFTQNGKAKSLVVLSGTGTDDSFAQATVVEILIDGNTSVNWNQTSTSGTGTATYTTEVLKTFAN